MSSKVLAVYPNVIDGCFFKVTLQGQQRNDQFESVLAIYKAGGQTGWGRLIAAPPSEISMADREAFADYCQTLAALEACCMMSANGANAPIVEGEWVSLHGKSFCCAGKTHALEGTNFFIVYRFS